MPALASATLPARRNEGPEPRVPGKHPCSALHEWDGHVHHSLWQRVSCCNPQITISVGSLRFFYHLLRKLLPATVELILGVAPVTRTILGRRAGYSIVVCLLIGLGGCSTHGHPRSALPSTAKVGPLTSTAAALARLGSASRKLNVAVYDFPDQTGALKISPNATVVDFSKAVTQGAASVLVDTLKLVGDGTWFNVVERNRLENLLRERRLVQDTYKFLRATPDEVVEPLAFAEYLIEGGITSFDSSISTGGVGARYLGIGGSATYQKNFVTVTLRIIDVRTGAVVTSVSASKTIYSVNLGVDVTKYVSAGQNLLEAQASFTAAEPTQIAVREAIEAGVLELISRPEAKKLWSIKRPQILSRSLYRAALRRSLTEDSKQKKTKSSEAQEQQQP